MKGKEAETSRDTEGKVSRSEEPKAPSQDAKGVEGELLPLQPTRESRGTS